MGVRRETVETPARRACGAPRGRGVLEGVRRGREGRARPPAYGIRGMLAYRSGVSAVAVEASMDNARKEGKLELTEELRSNDRS